MLNSVNIIGRLTADPPISETPDGTKVLSFTLAVDRDYTDKDGKRPADFVDCVAWRGTAEFIAKNFAKSDYIALSGPLQTRNYEDKDGNRRKSSEVRVDQANFCGYRRKETA